MIDILKAFKNNKMKEYAALAGAKILGNKRFCIIYSRLRLKTIRLFSRSRKKST